MSTRLSEELTWRGFVNQTTLPDISALDGDPITFYWGVDPSAPSMTIGNLAAAMMVRHFIAHGHKAVLLVGGATGMIGDPDGKSEERDLLGVEQLAANKAGIIQQYEKLFAGNRFTIVDNHDWFKDMGYLEFLRDVGKHVPMRQMLGRDFVTKRLSEGGTGISYAEFSYVLIQAYDFMHLAREKGVTLQVCGSDQWGNSIAGVDLTRRMLGKEAHVWSAPLIINKATGKKFGKSEEGAVWLDPGMTSPYRFYQFWLNADDEGVEDYLKIYTLLSKEEVEHLMDDFNKDRASRAAQKVLADEVTMLVHGKEKTEAVRRMTSVLFGKDADYHELTEEDMAALSEELPPARIPVGSSLVSALVASGLAGSNSEAMRHIAQGAVSLNGVKVPEGQAVDIGGDDTLAGSYVILRRGKNMIGLLNITSS